MVLVHDEVAHPQIGEGRDGRSALILRTGQRAPTRAEDLLLGENDRRRAGGWQKPDEHSPTSTVGPGRPSGSGQRRHWSAQLPGALAPSTRAAARAGSSADARPGARRRPRTGGWKPSARQRSTAAASRRNWPPKDGTPWVSRTISRHAALRGSVPATRASSTICRPRSLLASGAARRRRRPPPPSRSLGAVDDHGGRWAAGSRADRWSPAPLALWAIGERQHEQLVDPAHGPLGGRIEQADRLDVVPEELQARRGRVRGAEDVHDAAAHAPLPHLHHRLGALVARLAPAPRGAARDRVDRPHSGAGGGRRSRRVPVGVRRARPAWPPPRRVRRRAGGGRPGRARRRPLGGGPRATGVVRPREIPWPRRRRTSDRRRSVAPRQGPPPGRARVADGHGAAPPPPAVGRPREPAHARCGVSFGNLGERLEGRPLGDHHAYRTS